MKNINSSVRICHETAVHAKIEPVELILSITKLKNIKDNDIIELFYELFTHRSRKM